MKNAFLYAGNTTTFDFSAHYFQQPLIEWLGDNGWGVFVALSYHSDYTGEYANPFYQDLDYFHAQTDDLFAMVSDANVPLTLGTNFSHITPMSYDNTDGYLQDYYWGYAPGPTKIYDTEGYYYPKDYNETPVSFYHTTYDPWIAEVESCWGPSGSMGHCLWAYWYEVTYKNVGIFLREATDLHIRWGIPAFQWAGSVWGPPVIEAPTTVTDAEKRDRLSVVDAVDIEMWWVNDYETQADAIAFIRSAYPDITIGMDSQVWEYPEREAIPGMMRLWAMDGTSTAAIPSVVDQTVRYFDAFSRLKTLVGSFDLIEAEFNITKQDNTLYLGNEFIEVTKQQLQFIDSCNWDGVGRKVWGIPPRGLVPIYDPVCGYVAPNIDTFANTGNELILLKNHGTASSHDITVTSSIDPRPHKNYTLALSPDRGTIIGPYPLDEYGALPTITYDNTNLYVSILKVEPTA